MVPVTDSFFLEITVVKYKSGEFCCCCQNPQVSVFFSPVVCLLKRYHVVTRMRLRLSALIHLTSQLVWLSQSNALPSVPVQHVSVLACSPPPVDDKNTISWQTETNFFSKLSFSMSTYSSKTGSAASQVMYTFVLNKSTGTEF